MALTFEKKRSIRADLKMAIWLGPQLELVITRQSKASGLSEGIGKSNDTPLYYNESASNAQTLLRKTLLKWCLADKVWCRCSVPQEPCDGKRNVMANSTSEAPIQKVAAWLLEHSHQLEDEAAAAEIEYAVRLAMEAVDTPPNRIYLGDCPCGRKLYGDPEKVEIECDSCLLLLRVAILRAANQERGKQILVSSKDAARYMGEVYGVQVTDERIRKWASRGKLNRYPVADKAVAFKLGDIIDLCKVGLSQQRR